MQSRGKLQLHIAAGRAHVELAGAANLVFRVADHFVELGNPAHGARQGKDAGEELDGNADGALDDARVEVHVRIELALHEVVVFQGDLLDFLDQGEQGVFFQAQFKPTEAKLGLYFELFDLLRLFELTFP